MIDIYDDYYILIIIIYEFSKDFENDMYIVILKIISINLKCDTIFQILIIFIFVMIHEISINRPVERRLKIKINRTRVPSYILTLC